MPTMQKEIFRVKMGQRLRSAREVRGLTQTEHAKLLGKSKQQVSSWDGGTSMMLCFDAAALAQILSLDLTWFIAGRMKRPGTT